MNTLRMLRSTLWAVLIALAPLWAAAQTVVSFTVVNADTGADIATFAASDTVSMVSVVFTDSAVSRTESKAP
jgi:hypothetical protein